VPFDQVLGFEAIGQLGHAGGVSAQKAHELAGAVPLPAGVHQQCRLL
jgi:hypothetical protein